MILTAGSSQKEWPLEMLEPCAVKVACTVLRGLGAGNSPRPPDVIKIYILRSFMIEGINRNDPCPCGSGKKFKKCCIEKSGFNGTFDSLQDESFFSRLFNPKGKTNVLEFWIRTTSYFLVFYLVGRILEHVPKANFVAGTALLVLYVYLFVVALIRRAHDLRHSGWYCLTLFIPIWNIWSGIQFCFISGNNRQLKAT